MQKLFTSFFLVLLFIGIITSGDNLALAQEAFDADAATEAYLASIPAEDRAKSDAYFEGGYWLILWNTLYGLGAAFILLHFGISRKMRDLGQKLTKFKFIHNLGYVTQYLIVSAVIACGNDACIGMGVSNKRSD